jgi:hypothetical protein
MFMNRRERRSQAKKAKLETRSSGAASAAAGSLPPVLGTTQGDAPPGATIPSFTLAATSAPTAPRAKPGIALRLFSRLLLANWLIKRVHHPDIIGLLLQIAEQAGRSDAVAQLTLKLYAAPRRTDTH